MDAQHYRRGLAILAMLGAGLLAGYFLRSMPAPTAPDPRAIADAALLSIRDGGRLISYSARFASVVTASESHLGLTARKTLIMPGTIRYGINLARLSRENLAWDEKSKTLTVDLPPVEISRPIVDPNDVQEFSEGGVLLALTNSEKELDQANLRSAQDDLMRQARAAEPVRIAEDAAMRMAARSFSMPLRSAGIDASVAVRLVDSSGREKSSFLDRSHGVEDSLRDRRAGHKKD